MDKNICIHGHFYQPPRENPWLEGVELQDSAYPYHDWNERITAECYGPNGVSRMLDGDGKIVNIVNNYSNISFNFGPTLLSWMEQNDLNVYQAILEADKLSQEKFSGHGSAIAQAYNHIIMPLANERDKISQVVWGILDFEHRFGRKPEGMWLAETAVDLKTLEVLADHDIQFTILSPYQAARIRAIGEEDWQDATEGRLDPTTAYIQHLPSGKSIHLFFYDGPVARAVAFEKLLTAGEHLANRLFGALSDERSHPQMVHIATDGESYGHHHTHGDMALAYALHAIDQNSDVNLTIYAEYLDKHGPTHEVQIAENTAWSCSHGVERWNSNCGCNSGRPGWNQEWRRPLREALDWLRDAVAPKFEAKAQEYLRDPWDARNQYIRVILDRSDESIDKFLRENATRELNTEERIIVLKLMELQRHAMLMYTSCGWFFDEISGIETVQIIQYAGRVIQLAEALLPGSFEEPFLNRLEQAKSNLPEHKDGRHIYDKWVRPSVVTWEKIAAHYAVSSLFESYEETSKIYCYTAERLDYHSLTAGRAQLVVGRAKVTFDLTNEAEDMNFGILHFGDHNVNGGVRPFASDQEYTALLEGLKAAFERADFAEIIRLIDKGFGESTYSLKSLFLDEQRKVLDLLLRPTLEEAESVYRRLYESQLPTMRFLSDTGVPLPEAFRTATEFIISNDIRWAFRDDEPDLENVHRLLEEADRWGVLLDVAGLAYQLKQTLSRLAERVLAQPTELAPLLAFEQLMRVVHSLRFEVNLWHPQNVYYELMQNVYPDMEAQAPGDETAQIWLDHFIDLGDQLGIQVAGLKKKIADVKNAPTVSTLLEEMFTRQPIPTATYRLQLNSEFPFDRARELVPYLKSLGISDCYVSPILQARPGSTHGYDVCDHEQINSDLGGSSGFENLSAELRRHEMGLVLDTVPNHMGIGSSAPWWMDVLENGPSSSFAIYFDIDWRPVNPNLENKVLIPVLGDQYGSILESGQIQLEYLEGGFFIGYYEHRFPVAPGTYSSILEYKLEDFTELLGEDHADVQELHSIITAVRYLPETTETDPEAVAEKNREKEVIKRRIATLYQGCSEFARSLDETLRAFNGRVGDVSSFDMLDDLLDQQTFRPAFWRVAMEEINYRRFFDINDLAALRIEHPEVFEATHHLFLDLLASGKANGLRIDHPDGLWDPTEYFFYLQKTYTIRRIQKRLDLEEIPDSLEAEVEQRFAQEASSPERTTWPLYVVAEKILAESEPLPNEWSVHGTTGYDGLNAINGIFVESSNSSAFDVLYSRFLGEPSDFHEIVQSSKRRIMEASLSSEINSLSHLLDRVSERNRRYRDFTLNSLNLAVREIIACLEVYRTYITGYDEVSLRDRNYIERAVAEAKKQNPRTAAPIFNFIRDTLLLKNLSDFSEEDQKQLVHWVMKFQQITGPIMAKGVEDTSFYVYNRFVSLNEVGGHPDKFGVSLEDFHKQSVERFERWPHSMIASSTHDTKRSEDVRARLNVLSEIPDEWESAIQRWSDFNSEKKFQLEKIVAPSRNDEYFLYQTLVGAWPAHAMTQEELPAFRKRIAEYMQKATKEAKVHTSWVNPNGDYDGAVWEFVHRLLPDDLDDPFVTDLVGFLRRVAFYGFFNSLSQLTLKLTVPGVPDIYRGTELWDFSLVDPDNRRPVDFDHNQQILADLRHRVQQSQHHLVAVVDELLRSVSDGRIKMYTMFRLLELRRGVRRLFSHGEYVPASVVGEKARHVCAFLRVLKSRGIVVAVPRFLVHLTDRREEVPVGGRHWRNTWVILSEVRAGHKLRNIFTNQMVEVKQYGLRPALPAAEMFAHFPVFVGIRQSG
ncbi:MAG: malto-oligosyltrehalose synthase [Gemmataceae bacterium]